jgi:hypothetical protein
VVFYPSSIDMSSRYLLTSSKATRDLNSYAFSLESIRMESELTTPLLPSSSRKDISLQGAQSL